jgi:hypothetical protein
MRSQSGNNTLIARNEIDSADYETDCGGVLAPCAAGPEAILKRVQGRLTFGRFQCQSPALNVAVTFAA